MSKRRWLVLTALTALGLGALFWWSPGAAAKKAQYPGGSFSQWLAQGPAGFGPAAREFLQRNDPQAVSGRLARALRSRSDPLWKPYTWLVAHAPKHLAKRLPPWPEPRLVRIGAAYWLANMGPRASSAIPALRHVASRDPSVEVRRNAVWALGQVDPGSKESVAMLVKAVSKDADANVRATAAGILEIWGPDDKAVISAMIQALQDTNPVVRQIAAATLGKYGPRASAAIGPLSRLATTDDPASDYAVTSIRRIRGDIQSGMQQQIQENVARSNPHE